MRRWMWSVMGAAAVVALVAACGRPRGPVGTWKLDTAAFKADMEARFEGMNREMGGSPQMQGMVQGMLDRIADIEATLDIASDGTYTLRGTDPADGSKTDEAGSWTFEGDIVTLTPDGTTVRRATRLRLTDDALEPADAGGARGDVPPMVYRRS